MKQFKSTKRAERRGHLKTAWDQALQKFVWMRRTTNGRWVLY